MQYDARDIMSLRQAAKSCRELAAWVEDGFSSLSYAQLADEIEKMILIRETAVATSGILETSRKRLAA